MLCPATNTISDAIPGITLNLKAATSGSASLDLNRDTAAIKTKLQDLVSAYNDVESVLKDAYDKDSKIEGYGASLVSDSLVQKVRSEVRSIFTATSSTPGTNITALRDLGITITREGKMALDATKADTALATQFDDMVKMLSQNRTVPTTLRTLPSGLAGDAVKTLDAMIGFNGTLSTQSRNTTEQIAKYKVDLKKLDDRMTQLLERYSKQFSTMDSLVGQSNSMKTSLKSTFEGMMAQYSSK
jgi:flagellar hook-associated protein 2